MRRWQCWSGQPHQNVLMALGTQRTDQRSKHPRYPSGFRALKHSFGRSQMTSNWYHFAHICWRVLLKLYRTSLLSSLPRSLSLQGDDQPASQFQDNKFLYQDAFFFLQYVGWGSPVALSSGKLVLPVTMDVFLLHSLNGYPSSKSEAHKYRELVRFSTTRYHQTQHSTDRPWVVPRPV